MSILKAEGLYKTYGDKTLFDYISFHIEENERIGLIGPNGTGKSSLLKAIAGFESTEKGEITKSGSLQIEYLHQEPDLDGPETVLEHIYSGDSVMMRTMRAYEKALQELNASPDDQKKQENLLAAQGKMDEHGAWDANTAAKTILTKLGVADVAKEVRALSGGQKSAWRLPKHSSSQQTF